MSERAQYLTVSEWYRLNHAARAITEAYGYSLYQVGSSLKRRDFRDVDLRLMLDDDVFDAMFGDNKARFKLINCAISDWLSAQTGLPVDFQFQHTSRANAEFHGRRNAFGLPLDIRSAE